MAIGNEDIVIAVMGVTGCGKSTFIKKVTGRSDVKVGDSLTSETAIVEQYKFIHKGVKYVLVDTPGFDDTYTDNETIAKRVIDWLTSSFRAGVRLDGLIYLHRITDKRMSGSSFETLRMFRELCGDQGLKNVVLTSTFWDTVPKVEGEKRQRELESNTQFWLRMIQKGCKTARLDGTKNSCQKILDDIARNNSKVTMQIQQEVVIEGKAIKDTLAARETFARLQRELSEQAKRDAEKLRQEELRRMREIEERARRERQRVAQELERKRREEVYRRERAEERARKEAEIKRAREVAVQQRRLQEMREREEMLARKKEEEEARQAKAVYDARQAYYKNYSCLQRNVSGRRCDRCGERLHTKYTYYYHCCHCDCDDYNQCGGCGNDCDTAEHPYMDQRVTLNECIVM